MAFARGPTYNREVVSTSHHSSTVKVFQVFYDAESRRELDPQFIPYENTNCSKYFENQVISDLFDQGKMADSEYFGVVSWRIWQKVKKIASLEDFICHDEKPHDFYYANWWFGTTNNTWKQTEKWVGTDLTTWPTRLMEELGYRVDLSKLDIAPSFYNYQICRTDLYQEYVSKFLKPIMSMMEDPGHKELQAWLYEPVNYSRSPSVTGMNGQILKALLAPLSVPLRDSALRMMRQLLGSFQTTNPNLVTNTRLESITGRPHYTRHSFVLEGLFPTYAAIRGWSGKAFSK